MVDINIMALNTAVYARKAMQSTITSTMALDQAIVFNTNTLNHAWGTRSIQTGEKTSSLNVTSSSDTAFKILYILGKYSIGDSSKNAAAAVSSFSSLVTSHVAA